MSKTRDKIKIGIATEEQVNREFIDAWHRTQQGILLKIANCVTIVSRYSVIEKRGLDSGNSY